MGIIDFKEIPAGNVGDGKQDTFELFARDFFSLQDCKIVEEPDRGPDGGRDFIIIEHRAGTIIRKDLQTCFWFHMFLGIRKSSMS